MVSKIKTEPKIVHLNSGDFLTEKIERLSRLTPKKVSFVKPGREREKYHLTNTLPNAIFSARGIGNTYII